MRITIRVAMDLAGCQAGDDFGIAVICIRVAQQRRNQERHLHHVAVHGFSSDLLARRFRVLYDETEII
jgi:hypothetical protein